MGCRSSRSLEEKVETVKRFLEHGFYDSAFTLAKRCLEDINVDNLENFYIFKLCMSLLKSLFYLIQEDDEKEKGKADQIKVFLIEWYLKTLHRKIFFSKNGYLYNERKQIYSLSTVQHLKKICVELLKITYSPLIHTSHFEALNKITRITEFEMQVYFEHSEVEHSRNLKLLSRINRMID